MKKTALVLTSIIVCALTVNIATAKTTSNQSLASAIRLYKAGNYVQSYTAFSDIVKKDPSNAVAYYYLAMTSAQVGKKNEAIENYDRVLTLRPNGRLANYAQKGKICIETPDKCHEPIVKSPFGSGFSQEARSEFERQKIQNLMREINRGNDIPPQKFREYKDFSSEVPTNDEIVTALRTLQRAGLGNMINGGSGYNSDLSLLMDSQNNNNNNSYYLLNSLFGSGNGNISPQLIQAMLSGQMTSSF